MISIQALSSSPKNLRGIPDYASQDSFICCSIQSRLPTVLGVRSYYVEHNYVGGESWKLSFRVKFIRLILIVNLPPIWRDLNLFSIFSTTNLKAWFLEAEAGMVQWWEHSPPINVARVRFPYSAPYVGWVCNWFSSLLREVFLRLLRFPPLLKNQHFQIPIRSEIWGPLVCQS